MLLSILLQAQGGTLGQFLPFLLIIVVFYFFMIRPQMRRQKMEKKFRQDIKRGDKVITSSGIHGKIVELSDDTCVVETGAGKIKFERSAISMELTKKLTKELTKK